MRRLVGVLGILAALSVLGAAATAVVHRPATDTGQWLRAYGVEVAVPAARWRLSAESEAITYGTDATLHAPAVLDEGFCPSSDSSSRAFVGLLPPAPGAVGRVVARAAGRWGTAIRGADFGIVLGDEARVDLDVPVTPAPCSPTTVHLTAVGEQTPEGVVTLILVRDVGEPDDLSAADADAIVQSLRSRT